MVAPVVPKLGIQRALNPWMACFAPNGSTTIRRLSADRDHRLSSIEVLGKNRNFVEGRAFDALVFSRPKFR